MTSTIHRPLLVRLVRKDMKVVRLYYDEDGLVYVRVSADISKCLFGFFAFELRCLNVLDGGRLKLLENVLKMFV